VGTYLYLYPSIMVLSISSKDIKFLIKIISVNSSFRLKV